MSQRQRKASPAEASSGGNGVFYVVLVVIAVLGLAAIGYALTGGGSPATEPVELNITDARALYQKATPVTIGKEDAPIKIVEFADFSCPACREFTLQVRPKIMPYVESGEAQIVFYDFPLGGSGEHANSFLAARAARCAGDQQLPSGENGYWPMHEKLFQEQANWSFEKQVVPTIVGYAEQLGLKKSDFQKCVNSDRYADVVTADRMLGEELGVNSTPTVLVNNRRIGGRTVGDMANNILRILKAAAQQDSAAVR